jgi:predicted dehydrogenase
MSNPIKIGIIGAGRFAIDQHAPAFNALNDLFEVVAVCSRTQESARTLADLLPGDPDILTDSDSLLARDDIEAVDILLPIYLQSAVVRKALATGKHVFSEKPIETSVSTGRALIDSWQRDSVWMVGENWRYSASITRAAELVRAGELGQLHMFNWTIFGGFLPGTRYYGSEWRRDGSHPGGILLDGGIHFVAGLRAVLGEVYEVSARAAQTRADLNPLDTLTATLHMQNGLLGTFALTYASRAPAMTFLNISGENGFLEVNRDAMRFWQSGEIVEEIDNPGFAVQDEFSAFAAAIRSGEAHRNDAWQALQDVAVFAALLQSAETGETIQPTQLVS